MLFNWAHLHQSFRRRVPDGLYRGGASVERIEATPHGTTLHLAPGGSLDFDLVVCADGYRSLGRGLLDPGAAPAYRGMVLWRGLIPERDTGADALGGCDLLRPLYQGGHGVAYYVPGPGQSTEPGERLLMWGYYLQVPESALASVLVDDQERQHSGSVPFGKVHPEVRAALEAPPRGTAALAAVRAGATARQLFNPGHLPLRDPQLRARCPAPGRCPGHSRR